ncbi:MAG: ribosome assembly RNA-binding protein YhbY [Alphaproteobacteria bacterium]|nr:ribosome assembly RNA-binding protein YhbY [Alphaproteobacteria bacterium]
MALTGKQRRFLRAQAHHLDPVVLLGAAGLSDAVVAKVVQELEQHELIKVKVNDGPEGARELAPRLAERAGAELAQVIGKTLVLYRRRAKDPEIKLPV